LTTSPGLALAPVWVVAGPPGAGKTTVATLIAGRLDPPAAVLDKDTIYGGFVTATLAAAGQPAGRREGPWYDAHVKVHEYAGLAATAAQVRAAGCPVIIVAPFTDQLRDPARWADLVSDCGGQPVHLLWVSVAPSVLYARLRTRCSARDSAKLADYDGFVDRMRPGVAPPVPHTEIDNNGSMADLVARLALPVLPDGENGVW
jgi:predicted kinase